MGFTFNKETERWSLNITGLNYLRIVDIRKIKMLDNNPVQSILNYSTSHHYLAI